MARDPRSSSSVWAFGAGIAVRLTNLRVNVFHGMFYLFQRSITQTMTLKQQLQDHILQHGPMPFSQWMQRVLYTPELGYYSSSRQKFGPQGDFITAPELTPLFGATLAQAIEPYMQALDHPVLFEFGAGSGRLCVDLLTQRERLGHPPTTYIILEVSASLQARQKERIWQEIPHLAPHVQWIAHWPTEPFCGVIIANEVLDAMPVERFMLLDDRVYQNFIALDDNHEFCEHYRETDHTALRDYVHRLPLNTNQPYHSEVNLWLDDWFKPCSAMLSQGAMFVIDYGFPRQTYYHPDRHHGTLMCHYQHQAHANPLLHVGEQDITAHVDFTHVAEAADAAGFYVAEFTNQASFLLHHGLLDFFAPDTPLDWTTQQAINTLILPSEMGELFKVMTLSKHMDHLDLDCSRYDQRSHL